MMLEIKKERQEKEVIYFLQGELDMSTGEELDSMLAHEEFANIERIGFCLNNLDFIDSTGIGQLIKYYRQYSSQNIAVDILNENPEIEEVLELIGLREIMTNSN